MCEIEHYIHFLSEFSQFFHIPIQWMSDKLHGFGHAAILHAIGSSGNFNTMVCLYN